MGNRVRHRPPVPLLLLVTAALIVVGLLLSQVAIGFVLSVIRLALILVAFAGIAFLALYLWRRGDLNG